MFQVSPAHTSPMPAMTTIVLQTSVEKCSASASSASLGYFLTTRESARARVISIDQRESSTTIAVMLGAMCTLRKKSRSNASKMM